MCVQIYLGLPLDHWSRLFWVIEISKTTHTFEGYAKLAMINTVDKPFYKWIQRHQNRSVQPCTVLFQHAFFWNQYKIGETRRFQACTVKKSRPCRGTFARANQADRCMNLLHWAQRSMPWLIDTRGCKRKVECFSLFECYVTLPVGTWLIALEQSSRSQCGRLLRISQSHNFVLREKKETFSVVSL